jgi:hypothetical protein
MVLYQVQYKPINPVTNNPVTNTTLSTWDGTVSTTGGFNPNYDMMLMFIGTASGSSASVASYKRIENETWAVYCVKESIKAAMKVAKPLIEEYGIDNVQICKVVQANIDIVFGEDE